MTDSMLDDAPWMQPASLGLQLQARQAGRTQPVVTAPDFEPGRRHDAFATPLLGRLNPPQPSGWSPVYAARVRRAKGGMRATTEAQADVPAPLQAAHAQAVAEAGPTPDGATGSASSPPAHPARAMALRDAVGQASASEAIAALPAVQPQALQRSDQMPDLPAAAPQAGPVPATGGARSVGRADSRAPAAARRQGVVPQRHGIARAAAQLAQSTGAAAVGPAADPVGPWVTASQRPAAPARVQRMAARETAARPARVMPVSATGLRHADMPAHALPLLPDWTHDGARVPASPGRSGEGPASPTMQASQSAAPSAPRGWASQASAGPNLPLSAPHAAPSSPAVRGAPAASGIQRRTNGLPVASTQRATTAPPTIGPQAGPARNPATLPMAADAMPATTAERGAGRGPGVGTRLPLPAAGSPAMAASLRPGTGWPASRPPAVPAPAATTGAALPWRTPENDAHAASAATPPQPQPVQRSTPAPMPMPASPARGAASMQPASARLAIAASIARGATLQRQAAHVLATPTSQRSPDAGQPQATATRLQRAIEGRAVSQAPHTASAGATDARRGAARIAHDAAAPEQAAPMGLSSPARTACATGRLPLARAQAVSPASASGAQHAARPGQDFAARAHARAHHAGEPTQTQAGSFLPKPAARALPAPALQRSATTPSLPLAQPMPATAAAQPDAPPQAAPASLQRSAIAPHAFEPLPALSAAVMQMDEASADAPAAAAQAAPQPDLDELVERACSRVIAALALEQERRGVSRWL